MTIGSRAIFLCEPCQDRKEAALSIRRMCCGIAQSERTVFLFFGRIRLYEICIFPRQEGILMYNRRVCDNNKSVEVM